MISGDVNLVAGGRGAFWNTMSGFHKYFESIDIICPHVSRASTHQPFSNVRTFSISRGKFLAPLWVLILGFRICKRERPDLIVAHAYGLQLMALGAWLLSMLTRIPIVFEVHHIEGYPRAATNAERFLRVWTMLVLRLVKYRAAAFRADHKIEVPQVLRRLGVPAEKIKILYPIYLDMNVFHPGSVEANTTPKKYDVVLVARLATNKGLDIFVDMVREMVKRRPNTTALVVGNGPLAEQFQIAIKDLPITWHKSLPTLDDIANAYRESRIAVCTSFVEGGPRVVVEAMACGLPGVSSPVGVMPEVLAESGGGIIVDTWKGKDFAEAALTLLEDSELYVRIATAAVKTASQFEYSKTIDAYAKAYLSLKKSR